VATSPASKRFVTLALFTVVGLSLIDACADARERGTGEPATSSPLEGTADGDLAQFIAGLRAVDNHSHANSLAPADSDADALPLDGIAAELPATLRPDHPQWLTAYRALYEYQYNNLRAEHLPELRATMQRVAKAQGDSFPIWVLDRAGIDVMLTNRMAMGPGLTSSRFRWVSYVDPLMLPVVSRDEAAASPDRAKLFPLAAKHLRRYLADRQLTELPRTLEAYVATVLTPTLEAQRRSGCVAVKFEAAYLRALDFDNVSTAQAQAIYARFIAGTEPSTADAKIVQDYLFRVIAREAGRLGMAVHIHSFEGFGNAYRASGADPMLLESTFSDPTLAKTNFVIVHGGGLFAPSAAAMLWKPNVYVDVSMMTLAYPPARLATILRGWLTQFPDKVLFGSDAVALGPDMGWELSAWTASQNGRHALTLALSDMMRHSEVTRARAFEIATMVMRSNAIRLYGLKPSSE
jgi:uncharacterized protein